MEVDPTNGALPVRYGASLKRRETRTPRPDPRWRTEAARAPMGREFMIATTKVVAVVGLICLLLAISPGPVAAYVGPGAGLTVIGAALALVGGVVFWIFGFVWYPVKRLLRRRSTEDDSA